MDRFNRIYLLHKLLTHRQTPVSLKSIMEQLECSKSTANRMIEDLRDHLNAPLEYNRDANGYFYNQKSSQKPYELPGLWFSADELHGLLICQQILQNISPGILTDQIESLQLRINTMLSKANSPQPVIAEKIYIASVGRRLKDDNHFKRIATALFNNQQIHIHYQPRGHSKTGSERTISPQKLVYYRENWYLAAYCHHKKQLRLFSVDRINSVHLLERTAHQETDETLNNFLNSGYGIFSGQARHTALLEFTPTRAKWVADELWHPKQQGEWQENGHYRLSLPFSNSTELIMDILKYGADVKVIEPAFLIEEVKYQIEAMKNIYHNVTK